MDALADIRLVRGLLDQAEMGAVRAARRAGRSWAEVATMLGVTRQSAWERWRDLVEVNESDQPATEGAGEPLDLVVRELMHDRRKSPRRDSIRVVKARKRGDRGMLAVEFEDEFGKHYISFWGIDQASPSTWTLSGGSYSSRQDGEPTSDLWRRFGGWGDDRLFSFGGLPADPNVERVRVRGGADPLAEQEDGVHDGVVLFIDWSGGPDSVVEMFGRGGTLLHQGTLR